MKKTFTALSLLMACVALPAFAGDMHYHTDGSRHYYNDSHHHVDASQSTQTSSYTTQTTYRAIRTPLTPEQIAERRRLITKIEQDMKRVDLDKDREVSFDEYTYGDRIFHTDGMNIEMSFDTLDNDRNGKLSSQEIMEGQWAQRQPTTPVVVSSHTERVVYTRD